MSARTHRHPVPSAARQARVRLPWWSIALPAVAFVVLLSLLSDPASGHTGAGAGAASSVVRLVGRAVTHLAW